jgi:hypothetical protein
MATVWATNRFAADTAVLKRSADRSSSSPAQNLSALGALAIEGRCLLGAALLLLGILMMVTLWLLPIGIPAALIGVALIAAPAGK